MGTNKRVIDTNTPLVIIDPEFQALIPPLAPEELEQLEKNIVEDGECTIPLMVWPGMDFTGKHKVFVHAARNRAVVYCRHCHQDVTVVADGHVIRCRGCREILAEPDRALILIDGHHRYPLFVKHGIPIETRTMFFPCRDDVKAWMIRQQFGRRNLNSLVRAELAVVLKSLIVVRAELNLRRRPNQSGKAKTERKMDFGAKNEGLSMLTNPPDVDTRDELAKLVKVSNGTMAKAEAIIKNAPEELKQELRDGKTTINKAYQQVRPPKKAKPEKPAANAPAPEPIQVLNNMRRQLQRIVDGQSIEKKQIKSLIDNYDTVLPQLVEKLAPMKIAQ